MKKIEEHPGRLTLIPVGPLTNIALALKLRPDLIADIKEIVLMGGSITGGNITPAAEFNIYNDPEAADMVFHSGVPIVMVGLDVTEKTVLKPEDMEGISKNASQANELVWGLTDYHLTERGAAGLTMHDPLAVGVAIDPSFVAYREPTRRRGDSGRENSGGNRCRAQRLHAGVQGRSRRKDRGRPDRAKTEHKSVRGGRRQSFHSIFRPAGVDGLGITRIG